MKGWTVGDASTVLRTSDGGETWVQQEVPSTPGGGLNDIYFVDDNIGWIVGDNGVILQSTDSGESSARYPCPTENILQAVDFSDVERGWAVGANGTILAFGSGAPTTVESRPRDGAISDFVLEQNYPNPFNPSTTIRLRSRSQDT